MSLPAAAAAAFTHTKQNARVFCLLGRTIGVTHVHSRARVHYLSPVYPTRRIIVCSDRALLRRGKPTKRENCKFLSTLHTRSLALHILLRLGTERTIAIHPSVDER